MKKKKKKEKRRDKQHYYSYYNTAVPSLKIPGQEPGEKQNQFKILPGIAQQQNLATTTRAVPGAMVKYSNQLCGHEPYDTGGVMRDHDITHYLLYSTVD